MGILKKLNHYRVWQLVLLGIAMFCVAYFGAKILVTGVNPFLSIDTVRTIFYLLFGALYAYIVFFYERSILYSDKTGGRSYTKDHALYKRDFSEMIEYFQDSNKYRLHPEDFPCESWKNADGIILGHVDNRLISRSSAAHGNVALFALPGGGKTTSQMIPTALRFGGSVLAIDIKGDILSITKPFRKIKIFAPENPAESCHYNPLYGLSQMSIQDRKIALEQMAAVLVPTEKETYFSDGARDFFCGISLYMLAKTPDVTFPEIIQEILLGNGIDWVTRIYESTCREAQEYTNSFYGTNERNVAGAYQNLSKKIRPLSSGTLNVLLDGHGDCITPQTLESGCDVYLVIPQDKISIYAPLTTIIIQTFMHSFMSRPDLSSGKQIRPILFLLDEFDQLGFDFSTLMSALATLRSKKVSLFLAQQSISQLKKRYGDEGFRGIIDTCGYVCLMSAQDPDNREYFQKLIGKHKVYHSSVSEGSTVSRSSQESEEYIFQSQDFNNLGDNVLIYSGGKYIVAEKCNIRNQEALAMKQPIQPIKLW